MSISVGYGCLWPEGHFGRQIAEDFAAQVTAATLGELQVWVTPPEPDEQSTQQVIDGTLQMVSGHAIQEWVPELGLSYLPYLYQDFDHFQRIWSFGGSPVSDAMIACIKQRDVPVVVLGYSLIGARDMILRDRAIEELADFNGLRVRVDGSETSVGTFAALGAIPVTIEYHDVLQALEDGRVDAAENWPFHLIAMDWYSPCHNVSLTKHLYLLNVELINAAFWQSLEDRYQVIIQALMEEATARFAQTAQAARDPAIEELAHFGLAVNAITPDARAQMTAAVEQMKLNFVAEYGLEWEYTYILSHSR